MRIWPTDVRTRFPTPDGRSARQTADRSLSTFVGLVYPTGVEIYDRAGRGSSPSFPGALRSVVATTSTAVMEVFDRDRSLSGLAEAGPGDELADWLVAGEAQGPVDIVALITNDANREAIACPITAGPLRPAIRLATSS